MIRYLWQISAVICFVFQFSCVDIVDDGKDKEKDTYMFKHEKVTVTAKSDIKKETRQLFPLAHLFDNNPDTVWSPVGSSCQAKIDIVFSEPVYIQELIVLNGYPAAGGAYESHNRVQTAAVTAFKGEGEVSFGDYFSVQIKDTAVAQGISFDRSQYSTILRTKALSFEILQCYEVSSNAAVGLRGITIKYADKPRFLPTMSVDEIKRKYGANEKRWYIKTAVVDDPIVEEVIRNLMYLGLQNDLEAEKLFYSYYPSGTAEGEMHSYLVSWYKLTKYTNQRSGTI